MHRRSGCRANGAPATSLAASWWAHRHGDYATLPDALPPPGVDAVLEALSEADPPHTKVAEALTVFAWDCVSNSADLTCTLDDIDALWDILESTGTNTVSRTQARHWVTEAWVDAVAATRCTPGIDALSGLHTPGYLTGRVHELDRQAGDETAHLVLLVARWPEPESPWLRISCILQVASALRNQVRPEATLAQFGTHCAIALVPDDNRARLERSSLAKRFTHGEVGTVGIDVELVPLPEKRSDVTELIVRLQDGSMVGDKSGPIGRFPPRRNSLD